MQVFLSCIEDKHFSNVLLSLVYLCRFGITEVIVLKLLFYDRVGIY